MMIARLRTSLFSGAAFLLLSAISLPASPDDKMAAKDKMSKMAAMSNEDKASLFDKLPTKDKMAAMKMAGHDMSKMSQSDRMSMMDKMTTEEKAAAMDKMHMGKSKMKGDKMDNADKMKNK